MKLIKFTVSLAFLLSVASLAGSAFLFQRYHAEQVMRENLESEKVQLKEQNASLESQLAQLEQDQERLLSQIEDYTDQRDSLNHELDRAHKEAGDLRKQIRELESERDALTQRLSAGEATEKAMVQEANKLPIVPQAAVAPPPVLAPAKPVESPKAEKPSKKKSEKKKSEKEPEKKVEKKTELLPPQPVVDQRPTQVLSVNRKFNFVVVNVGLRDHIKIGDTLRVEQNGKLVGRIEVEKLYEHFSACTILEENKPGVIQEGDLVRIA